MEEHSFGRVFVERYHLKRWIILGNIRSQELGVRVQGGMGMGLVCGKQTEKVGGQFNLGLRL